ncbi:glycoside hydrolase, partial [bacterium]|nr:glycoside hydrolase [bacterium]
LWAGAGGKYSWVGICNCDTRVPNAGDREHEIYWWTGRDGSKILMKWNSLPKGTNKTIGGYAEARYPAEVVDFLDTSKVFISRYPYRIIGAFGKGWDDFKTITDEFVTVAKEKTNAERKVIVSNEIDFFKDFEAEYGSVIPSQSCSFGNEWELYCASMSEVSARVKRAVEKLRSAEALAVFVNLKDKDFMNGREKARDLAWMNLGIFWEHDWGMAGCPSDKIIKRIEWQKRITVEIEDYVNILYDDASKSLGSMIEKNAKNERFFVFNPLSWNRTDIADIDYSGSFPVHVIDVSTNKEVPSQIVQVDGKQKLRILAENIPSVGYKVFEIRSGKGESFLPTVSVKNNIIENKYYKITLSERGAITSLIDKTKGDKEIVRIIGGRAINDLGSSSGSLEIENSGCVSVTIKAEAPEPLKHTTRITLVRDSRRIDICNEITQNFGDIYTWAYGFNLNSPDVWHEEVGAVIRAKLLKDGGHYSHRNARYDWLTLGHFVDMSGKNIGVTLSSTDCNFMQIGNSDAKNLDTNIPQIKVLAGSRSIGGKGRYGIPYQGGDSYFLQRFALQIHDIYNETKAMKFALEHQNPLVTGIVKGGNDYPEKEFSLLKINNSNVLLWALKPADDGIINEGVVARVWNMDKNDSEFALVISPDNIISAKRMTHIETPIEDISVNNGALKALIKKHQMLTFAVKVISNN